jgi:hypothetical protein
MRRPRNKRPARGALAAAALVLTALGGAPRVLADGWDPSLPEPLLLPGEIDTCAGTS